MANEVFVLLSCDFLFAHLINKSRVHFLTRWEANTLGKIIFFLQRFTSYAVRFWLILLNQLSRDQLAPLPILLADNLHNYSCRRQNFTCRTLTENNAICLSGYSINDALQFRQAHTYPLAMTSSSIFYLCK